MNKKIIVIVGVLLIILFYQLTFMDIIDTYYGINHKERMIEDVSIFPSFVSETHLWPTYSCYIIATSKTDSKTKFKIKGYAFKKNNKIILQDDKFNKEKELKIVPYEIMKKYSGSIILFEKHKMLLLRSDTLELIIEVELMKDNTVHSESFVIPLRVVSARLGIFD